MTEITIKAYTRRGKNGKVIQVRGYTRRVGRKGTHSPKRQPQGKEFEQIVEEKKEPKLTPEELALRKEVIEGAKRAEIERRSLGMTVEQYSRHILQGRKRDAPPPSKPITSTKKPKGFFERIEDKIATLVEKYSNKKYKRQF